ncbi:MmgE/PrpD family protein [Caldimonas thermodepolymerans]|jgi:Uncharacterized protein involved in propionate catabolism|uniref:2-methylcitrate dehydratase PrpD n=1 Tax=Caldimonas thermodepolymerans TaxID=215580 RepID=A0A2S5T100_9BURK|nr:MmgE/PrpD family protein [Caldimonas thermodepolymerans]PPE68684.1 MmgE/PrpD family protein [Caldimonas thermodepolymerans]QPC31519.1 MmgE/PrpD family protein [Caldimonas thermodepolymerans]RDH95133.1 2-methylcitrate dehydratase PrpD [Caldimonas thermodepolymerans]TCP03242.1 2-methylcitrate dehydratase PrpD [Caldimonas thermodepolymerans]UZG47937.1 MmgE/PrpD family protein [Caldimonas thermodepolymerans]
MKLDRRQFTRLGACMAGSFALGPGWVRAQAGAAAPAPAPAASAAAAAAIVRDGMADLSDFCANVKFEHLPAPVVAAAKNQILDTLAIAVAARHDPAMKILREWTQESGGRAESQVWGSTLRVPAEAAARINASMGHALEFDDTYEPSFMHAAVVTVPAVLAVAELVGGVSGKELIAATAVGTDIVCRMSRAGSPGADGFVVGWDPTPMYGFIGSAMVAARLLGLPAEQINSAAGLALHQIAGNSQGNLDGAHSKRLGPGFASYGGIISARLVQRGVVGAKRVLEGPKGLYKQYHGGNYSRELLLNGLGEKFASPDIAFKPYPSCRGGHVAVDAALALRAEYKLRAQDVERIEIHCGPGEYGLLNAPLERKQRPGSVVDAQFSNPWVVAAALLDGDVKLEHFTPEALKRADLLAITARTTTHLDPTLGRPGGGPGAARVVMQLRDGRRVEKLVRVAKGDPSNPMSAAEFQKKFQECTQAAGMQAAQAERLYQQVLNLEQLSDARTLAATLSF